MGCFSAGCAITRMAVREGDKCVLLPVSASEKKGFDGSHIIYSDGIFQPSTFPIYGEYDGSGGICNIVEDDNTKAIEEYFGMPISTFVMLVSAADKDVYRYMTEFYDEFFLPKEEYESGDVISTLKSVGFEKTPTACYQKKDFYVVPREDRILDINFYEDGRKMVKGRIEDLFVLYHKHYGEWLGVKDSKKVDMLMGMSCMFMLQDAYEQFAKDQSKPGDDGFTKNSVNCNFLKAVGFTTICREENRVFEHKNGVKASLDDRVVYNSGKGSKKFHDIKSFLKAYTAVCGKILPIYRFLGKDDYGYEMELVKACIQDDVDFLKSVAEKKGMSLEPCDKKQARKTLKDLHISKNIIGSYFYLTSENSLLYEIYSSYLISRACMENYFDMERLHHNLSKLNIPYMPTFCGTQDGYPEGEKALLSLMKRMKKERDEQ